MDVGPVYIDETGTGVCAGGGGGGTDTGSRLIALSCDRICFNSS